MGCVCSVPEAHEEVAEVAVDYGKDTVGVLNTEIRQDPLPCIRERDSIPSDYQTVAGNALRPLGRRGSTTQGALPVGENPRNGLQDDGPIENDPWCLPRRHREMTKPKVGFSPDVLLALKRWDDECEKRSETAFRAIMRTLG